MKPFVVFALPENQSVDGNSLIGVSVVELHFQRKPFAKICVLTRRVEHKLVQNIVVVMTIVNTSSPFDLHTHGIEHQYIVRKRISKLTDSKFEWTVFDLFPFAVTYNTHLKGLAVSTDKCLGRVVVDFGRNIHSTV